MSTLKVEKIQHPNSASVALTLDTSGYLALQAGSASTPAIQGPSDPNTGIFFPAADTIAFAEGGAESLRIDSSGRVGIGTTNPGSRLTIKSPGADTTFFNCENSGGTSVLRLYQTTGGSGKFFISDSTGTDFFSVDAANGRVGVGISPEATLHVAGSTSGAYIAQVIQNQNAGGYAQQIFRVGSGAGTKEAGISYAPGIFLAIGPTANDTTSPIVFQNNNAQERMRIDVNGRVLVGTSSLANSGSLNGYSNTAAIPAGRFVTGPSVADGNLGLAIDKYSTTNTTSQWFIGFTVNNQNTANGVITANGSSQVAFGTWSDQRLKKNIADLPSQLENICALRPVEFDYIEAEGGGHQISFIAQEFEKVFPEAVGERPDGMKTLTGWGKTEAILVKAIQDQQQIIKSLEARLTAAGI